MQHHHKIQTGETLTSLPQITFTASRREILDYFDNGWNLTELLFSGLTSDAAYYRRPYHQLRHPMIFYYGHPATLYINKLRVAGLVDKPLNPELEIVFETGVDEMRWDDLHEGEQDLWPSIEAVRSYRAEVYQIVREIILTHPLLDQPVNQDSPMWALFMGFEHERIHLETSSVLMRELPIGDVKRPEEWPGYPKLSDHAGAADNTWITVDKSKIILGKPADYPTFGWDNEYGHETRQVRSFSATSMLISNHEFYQFVTSGGYTTERYWSVDGWGWRSFRNNKAPIFWVATGPAGLHHYKLRTIFDILPMQWDWPSCVNYHEAKAYAAWRSEQDNSSIPYRLLTEAEHSIIRQHGDQHANLGLMIGSERSVHDQPANKAGFYDAAGNVWQWCEDHFHPLEGAKPHPYYDDFSVPCYDGEHQMMLGGSFISTGDEASPYARFHFRPHFFQHAGFRLARSNDGNPAGDPHYIQRSGTYETRDMLDKYLLMHFGENSEIYDKNITQTLSMPDVVNLPVICAELVTKYASAHKIALDLGCAVGRSSFALAKSFEQVIGIDYSFEFIRAANTLTSQGRMSYFRRDQGNDGMMLTATIDPTIDRKRLTFQQGDACHLPEELGSFDAVLLANVLCRLPEPALCLQRLSNLVNPDGVVVMTTPLSWLAEYTPEENWLKGLDDIATLLPDFNLIHQQELPFMIREHARKFEYIVTQASVWKKR